MSELDRQPNRLNELIAELCPDGVEYKELGKVVEIRSGWGFPNKEQGLKHGEIPFYKVGDMNHEKNQQIMTVANNYISLDTVKRLKCNPAPKGTIIFPKIGAAIRTNKKRILGQTACYDNNVVGLIVGNDVLSRFLFFIMDSISLIDFADYSGAMPSIRKSTLEKYKIPVPPLPVQREIVRILDNFTELVKELTTELTAELTARQKQYEYYRDKLLTFGDEVEFRTLEEVFNIKNGYTPSKSNPTYWENGSLPWFRMEDIRKNGRILSDSIQHITPQAVKGKLFPANSIILATSATIGEHALLTVEALANQRFTFLSIKKQYVDKLNMKFFYYYCFIIDQWCKNNTSVGNFHSVEMVRLKKYRFPLPTLPVQREIVAILDRFDALCNDLTSALPAEIEARQKQYEYYRDKLLSFKEMKS